MIDLDKKRNTEKETIEFMRYSGPRMMFYNPIMVLKHIIYGIKDKVSK